MDLVAARDHMTNLVCQLMQPQVLFDWLVQIILQIIIQHNRKENFFFYFNGDRNKGPMQYFGSVLFM